MRRRAGRFPAQERDACCSAESFSASVLPEALLLPEVLADVLWDELPDEEADELWEALLLSEVLCDEEAEELWDVLALPEEELLPEDAVLCELLLSAPFEALLEPDEAVEEDVVPEEAPEELPDDAPEDPVLPDELEDELDELELPEAAGAPATVTSSVLLVTVQSL